MVRFDLLCAIQIAQSLDQTCFGFIARLRARTRARILESSVVRPPVNNLVCTHMLRMYIGFHSTILLATRSCVAAVSVAI